jgi:murein endopeptidase
MAKISLKPVEKKLLQILRALKKEATRINLVPAQKQKLAKDIGNVKKLIKRIPPNCRGYDLGI